ncbi:MAG: LysR family transcriptional regulator [Acidobacteriota bacterium]|nr:LysR family transcriptional regulator [Acidobacteriota bacterium]
MDLLQLEHFLAVVDERSFTRAAERVSRTQSAVSQSIKKLEGEIGAPLFARDVHDLSLTEAGTLLAEHARRMVRNRDEAMRQIGALRDLKLGTLNIAAHESAAVYLLPAPLRAYLTRFPDIKVGIYRSEFSLIPRQVLDREVQIGFVEDEPSFHELTAVEVHCDQMVLVASPRHPLATRQQVRLRDLDGEHFVFHRLCSTTEQVVMRLFAAHNTRCRVAAELWSFENVKSFVQGEVGLAIVPSITVAQELRDRTLAAIPVRELNLRRRTLMIYRDQGFLSEPARELVKIVSGFDWEAVTRCA